MHSIIALGSVTRPEDFVKGLSDVDLLVIVKRKVDERLDISSKLGADLEINFMTPAQLKRVFQAGEVLSYLLVKDSVILYDDGTFAQLCRTGLKHTQHTEKELLNSALVALSLAVKQLYSGSYGKSVNHSYHAVRHAARGRALKEKDVFLVSDRDVLNFLQGRCKTLYSRIVSLRKKYEKLNESEVRRAVESTIQAVGHLLELQLASLRDIQEELHKKFRSPVIERLQLKVKGKQVVWSMLVSHKQGFSSFSLPTEVQ